MKKLRKVSKKYYLRLIVACWLVSCMTFVIPAQVAMAATPVVSDAGGATVIQGANFTDVLVNQQETLMTWSNFDTTGAETVAFRDGGLVGTKVLITITGGPTEFCGHLPGEEGMDLYFRNPAGFLFGSGSTVNVTELAVTSLNIDAADVLNGLPYTFTGGVAAGDVMNEGTINAGYGALLIGKNVRNEGIITADQLVALAAGDMVVVSEIDGGVGVKMSIAGADTTDFSVVHVGDDSIDAKQVILAAGDIWSSAYISAYSDGGSDAVAKVDISAAGDVSVNDKIKAEAVGDGVFNATAGITIVASGDVEVRDDIATVAKDGSDNIAITQIYASEVCVTGNAIISTVAGGAMLDISDFCLTQDGRVLQTSGNAELIINHREPWMDMGISANWKTLKWGKEQLWLSMGPLGKGAIYFAYALKAALDFTFLIEEAILLGLESVIDEIVADPPDPNYNMVYVPEVPDITIEGLEELSSEHANILQKAIDLRAKFLAYMKALLITMEREAGAREAGDQAWLETQQSVFRRYSMIVQSLIKQLIIADEAVGSVIADLGITSPPLQLSDIENFQQYLSNHGLPEDELYILSLFGIEPNDVQEQVDALVAIDPCELVGATVQDVFSEAEMFEQFLSVFPEADNYMPIADAGGPYIAQAGSWSGASVILDGTASSDPDGNDINYEWDLDVSLDSDGDGNTNNDVDANQPTPEAFFPQLDRQGFRWLSWMNMDSTANRMLRQ